MFHRTTRGGWTVAIALLMFLLVGCTPQSRSATGSGSLSLVPAAPGHSIITVSELARRLNFGVRKVQPNAAFLYSGSNSLVIVPGDSSVVYFNNRVVLQTTGVEYRSGQFLVPAELEIQIRQVVPAAVFAGYSQVRPAVARSKVGGRVVLDAGHGGKDPGTRSGGMIEKYLVLDVTRATAEQLRARGVTVILTRTNDTFLELADRVSIANSARANLFLAIHADYNPSSEKSGHSILLPQSGNPYARAAAFDINRALVQSGSPSRAIRTDDRGLFVLRHTTCPSILLELGFLSNPADAARLRDPAFRTRLARAISDGICDYLRRR